MNGFDIVLLVLACILVVLGMLKGLVRILIGLAALVAAFMLAAQFHRPFADLLARIDISTEVLRLIAYVVIFIGVMLAGGVIAFIVRKLLKAAMLGWADRLAGAALGLVAAMLIAALLALPLVAYLPNSENVLGRSVLAPYVVVVADLANRFVPADLAERYHRRIEDLRRHWHERWIERSGEDPANA